MSLDSNFWIYAWGEMQTQVLERCFSMINTLSSLQNQKTTESPKNDSIPLFLICLENSSTQKLWNMLTGHCDKVF